ncbi:MAG: O-antigen ligase family protein [Minisyncoccia bacterium]
MLLAIFLIIFSAIAFRNVCHGAYLVIFSMPLYLWRFSVLGIPSTALEAMIYILFLVWIINLRTFPFFVIPAPCLPAGRKAGIHYCDKSKLFSQGLISNLAYTKHKIDSRQIFTPPIGGFKIFWNDTKTGVRKNSMLNVGITLLFLGVIISTSISSDPKTSLGILKGWFLDPFLFFLVFISIVKTKDQIVLSLAAWLFSGAAVSIISIFYLLNGELTFDGRLSAFFLSPNHLAMYLAPAFLIVFAFLIKNEPFVLKKILSEEAKLPIGNLVSFREAFFSRKLQVIVLTIISIPLYFTHSYGAFLEISADLFYMFGKGIFKEGQSKKKKSYLAAALIILSLGVVFGYSKMDQIENSNGRSSLHSRLMIWNASGEMIKESPLVGIGPGTFEEKYLSLSSKFKEPYLEWAVPQPHNIFLAFYLQTGLLGFIGFLLILLWFFKNKDETTILKVLMLYFLFHGLIDTTYWKNDLALMFWLVLGLSAIRSKNADSDKA